MLERECLSRVCGNGRLPADDRAVLLHVTGCEGHNIGDADVSVDLKAFKNWAAEDSRANHM